jgi:hypothetical protein
MKLGSEIQTVALYPLHGLVIEKIDSYIIQIDLNKVNFYLKKTVHKPHNRKDGNLGPVVTEGKGGIV